jgi:hypothetical protein
LAWPARCRVMGGLRAVHRLCAGPGNHLTSWIDISPAFNWGSRSNCRRSALPLAGGAIRGGARNGGRRRSAARGQEVSHRGGTPRAVRTLGRRRGRGAAGRADESRQTPREARAAPTPIPVIGRRSWADARSVTDQSSAYGGLTYRPRKSPTTCRSPGLALSFAPVAAFVTRSASELRCSWR